MGGGQVAGGSTLAEMDSGKGSVYPSEHLAGRDRATGVLVHQMTQHPSINHPAHFLQSSFTPDGAALIFTSYRTGTAQLFEARFPDGLIRQLTDGPPIHPYSAAIHPNGERIFFVRGGSVWRIDRIDLEERCIVSFGQARLGECSLAGEWLTAAALQGNQHGLVVGRTDGARWDFFPFSRAVIRPQFHPVEQEWIEFGAEPAPRMHRIRRDGQGLECLYYHGNDEFVVHETFLGKSGDLIFALWPRALCRMDWRSRLIRTVAEFNAWHIASNRAGTQILCDTNHPDEGLLLVDVASGARQSVCRPESSNQGSQWKESRYAPAGASEDAAADTVYGPHWTHPHPSFSWDEQRVVFTSDRSGHPQVYVAELGDLPGRPFGAMVM